MVLHTNSKARLSFQQARDKIYILGVDSSDVFLRGGIRLDAEACLDVRL